MMELFKRLFNSGKTFTEKEITEKADKIIKNGKNINAPVNGHNSLLHISAANNYMDAAKKLLSCNADVNCRGIKEMTPLHSACLSRGDTLSMIRFLIENHAEPLAVTEKNETPLHFAAYFKDLETGEYLIRHYTSVDITDNENETPLHKAAYWGNKEMTESLLKHRADKNAVNADGMTPLHLTVFFLRSDVMETLLKNGADPNIKNRGGETPLFILTHYILPDNKADKQKMHDMLTAHGAVSPDISGNKKKIAELIDRGITLYEKHEFSRAIAIYNEALKLDPEDTCIFFNRANALYESGNYPAACEDFTRVILKNPEDSECLLYRGETYVKMELFDKALEDFTSAIKSAPSYPDGYLRRGVLHFSLNRLKEAEKDLIKASGLGNARAGELLARYF